MDTERSEWVTSGGFSKKPLEGDCMYDFFGGKDWQPSYITTDSGERVYVGIDKSPQNSLAKNILRSKYSLLSTSMSELKQQAANIGEMRALARESKMMQSQAAYSDSFLGPSIPVDDQLWVDKYAPKNFLDLLSDDKTNRSILSWLKEWDPYVFKVRYRATFTLITSELIHQPPPLSSTTQPAKWKRLQKSPAPADLNRKFYSFGDLQVHALWSFLLPFRCGEDNSRTYHCQTRWLRTYWNECLGYQNQETVYTTSA